MPTLSQCNILNRLITKQFNSRTNVNQADSNGDGTNDGPETIESDPRVAHKLSEPDRQNGVGFSGEDSEDVHGRITRTDTPREVRTRSSKFVRLAESFKMKALPEVETNDSFEDQPFYIKPTTHQSSEVGQGQVESNCDPLSVRSIEAGPPYHNVKWSAEEAQSQVTRPVRPCLKRSDSCFIKRPDSRSKSVTFKRPSSEAGFRQTGNSDEDEESETEAATGNGSLTSTSLTSTRPPEISRNNEEFTIHQKEDLSTETTKRFSYSLRDGIVGQRQPRPSSCGPALKRTSPFAGNMQMAETHRRKSLTNERPILESSTESQKSPARGSFLVRRGSIINKTLFSNNEISHLIQSFQAGKPTNDHKAEPYEPYIIRNCRLIRRDAPGMSNCSLGSPKDIFGAKRRFEFGDCKEGDKVDGQQKDILGEVTQKIKDLDSSGDLATPGGHEGSDSGFPDLQCEIRRWCSEKQAIVVERPNSGSDFQALSNIHRANLWNEDLKISEKTQQELQKLGFRKPVKGKKKKKYTQIQKEEQARVEDNKHRIEINLKEDPMLIKVSKKNRNIGKFISKPELQPMAVCFEIYGSNLTHRDVKCQLVQLLQTCPEVRLSAIKFDHRAVYNNSKDMLNRWIITASSVEGRNRLAGSSLTFSDQLVQLRRYDDVINCEYQQFTRMQNFVKMMNNRKILGKSGDSKN